MLRKTILFSLASLFLLSCSNSTDQMNSYNAVNKGKLFIIGGGKRPESLVKKLIQVSGIDSTGYTVILPMSSSEPDTSAYYGALQFKKQGIQNIAAFNFEKEVSPNAKWIDSLKNAQLIYITGGDQRRFMDIVLNTEIHEAIKEAYKKGATVAGTSAGAAVMSKKMITGDEIKHEYTGDYRTIEQENMIIEEGLGLLENAIIDQHFIWRMRMNRLMTVAIEHPNETAIGIDESTAIIVSGNTAEVAGISQVIVIKNPNKEIIARDSLLGAKNMNLSVYLPGDTFFIK